jgi:hypothetical protein
LSRRGDVDAAGKILERISASDASEQQRKLGGLQINKAKRTETEDIRAAKHEIDQQTKFEKLKTLSPTSPEYVALKADIDAGAMAFNRDKAQATKLAEVGLDEKTYALGKVKATDSMLRALASKDPKAIGKLLTDEYHDGYKYGTYTDPTNGSYHVIQSTPGKDDDRVVESHPSYDAFKTKTLENMDAYAGAMVVQNAKHRNEMEKTAVEVQGKKDVARIQVGGRAGNHVAVGEGGVPLIHAPDGQGYIIDDGSGTRYPAGAPVFNRTAEKAAKPEVSAADRKNVNAWIDEQVTQLHSDVKRDPKKLAEAEAAILGRALGRWGISTEQWRGSASAAPTAGKTGSNMEQRIEANRAAAGTQSATPSAASAPVPAAPMPSKELAVLEAWRKTPEGIKATAQRAVRSRLEAEKEATDAAADQQRKGLSPTPAPTPTPEGKKAYQTELDRQILLYVQKHPKATDKEMNDFAEKWRKENPGGSLKSTKPLNEGDRQILLFRKNNPKATEKETDDFTTQLEKENPEIFKTPPRSSEAPAPVKAKEPAPAPAPVKAKEPAPTPAPVKAKEPAPTPAPVKSEGLAPAPAKGSTLEEMRAQLAVNSKRIAAAQKANKEATEKLQEKMQQEKENR